MILSNISLVDFAKQHNINISSFENSRFLSEQSINKIKSIYTIPPFSSDEDFIVFGSIARRECTEGSDIDWTLLVDGQANPRHGQMENEIRKKLTQHGFDGPGSTGMFGHISFSHELIHNIGGQADTNHNLTKRILLLLESSCIYFNSTKPQSGSAYDRIIKGVLSQYIEHDSGLNSNRPSIPRYLLNDIVRFWRTMCVDFAYKQKEQEGEKWALRNIKLRISRKMLYVKGLLMCLSHHKQTPDKAELILSLDSMIRKTPIELLISLKDHFQINTADLIIIVECYNEFLLRLNDSDIRNTLSKMNMNDIYDESSFLDLRNTADKLQEALSNIFINNRGNLSSLTLQYGIF